MGLVVAGVWFAGSSSQAFQLHFLVRVKPRNARQHAALLTTTIKRIEDFKQKSVHPSRCSLVLAETKRGSEAAGGSSIQKSTSLTTEPSLSVLDTPSQINQQLQNQEPGGGSASTLNLSVSLVKNIVGSGVLALPAGLITLGDTPQQVLPTACLLITAAGAAYGYFFYLVGQVCAWTGAQSYREAWDETMGTKTGHNPGTASNVSSQAVAASVALKTALTCVAYSMILADSFQSLAVSAGYVDVTRLQALMAVTGTGLLPLCLLKDLSSLGPFSALALLSFGVTVVTVVVRALDATYSVTSDAATMSYLSDLPESLQPAFGDHISYVPNIEGAVLMCTLATAFVAHYNAPRFYNELKDNTMERFGRVVTTSFSVATLVFIIVSLAGFVTFGTAAQPMILNSYSPYDPLVSACRASLAASLLLTFPLPFVGLRDGVLDLWRVPNDDRTEFVINALSIGLLALVTIVAVNVHDLGLLLSVGGGTFTTAVAAVFPVLMFRMAVKNRREQCKMNEPTEHIDLENLEASERQSHLALILMIISVVVGLSGVSMALNDILV